MKTIKFLPAVETQEQLNDLIARASWHLTLLDDFCFKIYLANHTLSIENATLPSGFDPQVKSKIHRFLSRCNFVPSQDYEEVIKEGAAAFIKWEEDNSDLNDLIKKYARSTVYRTDPTLVRQEGSFYIQCAFDLSENDTALISESQNKFTELYAELGKFDNCWVLATGPSVEKYVEHDFNDSLTIACNSTIFDEALIKRTQPKILVFADPIFHFGVSEYAGKFRDKVNEQMNTLKPFIIVPFKYYRLLVSIFPEHRHRIIGVPFNKVLDFNLSLQKEFYVKTTSNILTLLLLPLATSFSDNVNILGCDGRPFENDDYFWGHGKNVQINDKMKNIKIVHPGFFDIDYNEYYFEHCHTLKRLFETGERNGKRFAHHASSYIPALRDRQPALKERSTAEQSLCILVEPDGLGEMGHYVDWHNQLITELKADNRDVRILCNKKQDIDLYNAPTTAIFTSHSWGISRGDWCFAKDFDKHPSFIRFFSELKSNIEHQCNDSKVYDVRLFMYYGSIQILAGLHKLRKDLKESNIELHVSLCLFHESVILNDKANEPRLPYHAREILLEALAQEDNYTITSVTEELKSNLLSRLEVSTGVMPNPIPAGQHKREQTSSKDREKTHLNILIPCALRAEKGESEIVALLLDVKSGAINLEKQGLRIVCRKPKGFTNIEGVDWISEKTSQEEYRQQLESSDCIIIPYLAPQFSYRTSGIIVDAMFAKKPIIAIQDTWLSSIVAKYRCGLTVKYRSSASFMSAVKIISRNKKFFDKYCSESFENYHKENSWDNLYRMMFKPKKVLDYE
ncbi:hypothetical protein ACFO4O_12680 [Glaciecola siphonariae]|uniref:Uncharacterized protein n=1 Tax=Glaciecola siphonariae TaxID=521012 RepID=A0ABV9LWW0_9ALTE